MHSLSNNSLSTITFLSLFLTVTIANAAETTQGQEKRIPHTWSVVDTQGAPVQDADRVKLLNSVVDGFGNHQQYLPPGSSLVMFAYEGARVHDPVKDCFDYDITATIQGDHGQWMTGELNYAHNGVWNAVPWRPDDERTCQFFYQRWGCAPITIRLPDKTDCIIDVGELHPAPLPTGDQEIRLVGDDGTPVDAQGSIALRLANSSGPSHCGKLDHGIATIPGMFAGRFLLMSSDLEGYTFGSKNDNFTVVRTVLGEPVKVPVKSTNKPAAPENDLANYEKTVWMTDYPGAVAKATQAGNPLLLQFTGSDWCGWCKKLHKEVFDTTTFAGWAKEKVVLVELDFPRKNPLEQALKEQNEALAKRFDIGGYPTIVLLDPTGTTVLGTMGYQKGGPVPWTSAADALITKAGK